VGVELQRQQVEIATEPCRTLDELAERVRDERRQAAASAREVGADIAPLGSYPEAVEPIRGPDTRYRRMAERFGLIEHEQLCCGCHVHVEIDSEEEGVAVLRRTITARSATWWSRARWWTPR
jgi:carboxylate-amine ligase